MIDRLSDEFEAAWRNNQDPQIEDYLVKIDSHGRDKLFHELLQIELQLKTAIGDRPVADEYAERFPDYTDAVRSIFADGETDTLPLTGQSTTTATGVSERLRYFGEYELEEEIARGGMGVVFKARQVSLNRVVALKMILAGQLAGEEDVQRFYTEAEAAANLDHHGIVPIFEIGEHEGQHYFSMGYVEGESLAHRVANGALPPREAAELVRGICDAIAYAHSRGVIHRDLKPANILIGRDGQPKVTDFGLAKKTETDSNLTGTGQVLGTPAFMPPEQASGNVEAIGPLADVYSLGAVLFCLLTGQPPFQAPTAMDTLLQVLEQEPTAPRKMNQSIPADLETICLKCLEKQPENRFGSAQDVRDELDRYLNGEPIITRRLNVAEWCWRWAQRRPGAAAAMVIVVIVAALIAGSGGAKGLLLGIGSAFVGGSMLAFVVKGEKILVVIGFVTSVVASAILWASTVTRESPIALMITAVAVIVPFAIAIMTKRLWNFALIATILGSLLGGFALFSDAPVENIRTLIFISCILTVFITLTGAPARFAAWWLQRDLTSPVIGSVLGLIIGGPIALLTVILLADRYTGIKFADGELTTWFMLMLGATITSLATCLGAILGALGGHKIKNPLPTLGSSGAA